MLFNDIVKDWKSKKNSFKRKEILFIYVVKS